MVPGWLLDGAAVYVTILLLEVVDRTNMVTISLAAKRRPRDVWIGASLAFVLSTALAVTIGALFVDFLVRYLFYVKLGGGIFVAAFGAWGLLRAEREEEAAAAPPGVRRTVVEAFLLILALEMGDDTQVLTVLFVASLGNALLVFVAASLGLVTTSAVGSKTGSFLRRHVPPRTLARVSSGIIVAVGLVLVLLAFHPL